MEITKLKNTTAGKKNLLDGLNSRMEMTEDRSDELEDRSIEFTQSKQQTDRKQTKKITELQNSVRQ